jgi:predicted Zn finger-like uncharacterized protein
MYIGEWELNRDSMTGDVDCPECGARYAIDDYPEQSALASVAIECEDCGTKLTLTMHNVPTFVVTYRGE